MEMRDLAQIKQASASSLSFIAFPCPDLTDHLPLPFVDLLNTPDVPLAADPIVDQGVTAAEPDNLALRQHGILQRAILLASAIATACAACAPACMRMFRPALLSAAQRTMVIAPHDQDRRMCVPIFEIVREPVCLLSSVPGRSPSQPQNRARV